MNGTTSRVIKFTLNGRPASARIEPHQTVLELVRQTDLFGARESCSQGLCGCCTVLVNGISVSGCLYLAAFCDGAEIVTVEGIAAGGELHPVQQAFIEAGAFQCGFCTPGFVLMTTQLLEQNPDPSDDEIKHYLAGNLCRCGAYPEIVQAVKLAAGRMKTKAA